VKGQDPGTWEGDIAMPANADCGEWNIHYIRVADNAGNISLLVEGSPKLPRVAFNVVGDACDSSAPTIESLTLSPTLVSNDAATEIQITAQLHDEGSGTNSMSGWVTGPVATNGQFPRIFFSCTHASADPDAPWTGKILVPQFAAKGIWRFGLVRLQDKALNIRDYKLGDPATAQATFEVQ
jgi:hypothetical protein